MISILLATYNGEQYIAGLIESLLSQTFRDYKLYIRDDKSTDGTYPIITGYAAENPDKIFVSQNEENVGGAKNNFIKMMIDHKDDYIMLCDQDDIWLPDKIEKSLSKIKGIEQEGGLTTPIMVHTDLTVVDEDLTVISASYKKMSNKDFEQKSLNFAVTMNNAAGCTIIYNRALADLIQAEPEFIVMHDWWVFLIASAFGKIGVINEPTILHRQHKDNESGAKKVLSLRYVYFVLTHLKKMSSMINDSYRQAGIFLEIYKDKLTAEKLELLSAYASIPGLSRIKKLRTVMKYKTFMNGFARKVAQVMILIGSREQGTGSRE